MRAFVLSIILVSLIRATVLAQTVEGTDLPYRISEKKLSPLRSRTDTVFQNMLSKELKQNKEWKTLITEKKMAIGVVDISDPENIKYARVNGGVMMYAASLPKIAILLSAMDAFERGEIEETESVKDDLRLMISKSDNNAASRMIELLGYEKIEEVLTDPKYELYDEEFGGGLWVGKEYARQGERNPDPLMGLSHAATVTQVCRFYYLMAFGRLVSYERSLEMLLLMEDPELHHKFVNTLDKIVPDAIMFRKSGTWREWHSDSILVWGPKWRRYILVGLIEDYRGEEILRTVIPVIEKVLQSLK
ncbi:MAG: serine hydrolase [Melioribacteraceae bacterium]|nr:serine hydrolase [Melioribacteraceae bacterium]